MFDLKVLDTELSSAITLLVQAAETLEGAELEDFEINTLSLNGNVETQIRMFLEFLEEAAKLISMGIQEGLEALRFAQKRSLETDESLAQGI